MDKVGAIASAACAVHCLVTGVAFGVLSVTGLSFLGSAGAEIAFFAVAILVGSYAIYSGHRKHGSWIPAAMFISALGILFVSHGIPSVHETLWGTITAVMGGLTLVAFHLVNSRLPRRCECEHCQARPESEA